MAVIQIRQKYLAVISIIILGCLLVFQVNLPFSSPGGGGGMNRRQDIETSRHRHNHFFAFGDAPYLFFGRASSTTTEVPRNILDTEIRYIINNPICDATSTSKNEQHEIFMLVLVTSYVGDVKLRRKLREVIPPSELEAIRVKRLFLLAMPPPRYQAKDAKYVDVSLKEIMEENQEFGDILMGDFTESYKSLTYKHLMGLEWAATFCQNAKFVLKQDDDIAVDYFQIHQLLRSKLGEKIGDTLEPRIFGKILENQRVDRDPESKWFVSPEEYPDATYPAYVSGWGYVTTIQAIQEILKASQENPKYFFIDDAFVTGILREKTKSVVSLVDMADYFTHYKGQLLCCVSVPMFARSKDNQPFWCDYLVGPSNGDLELLEIYQRHSQYCFVSKQCRRREENERLERKCVITGNMKIQDFSQLQGQPGKAKPLAVIRKQ